MLKDSKINRSNKRGFTIVELLVIAPIVILTIGAFVTVIVNMTGDVLASRSTNVLTYNIQDALNRIESDVKLSSGFLAANNITPLTSPQGFGDDTTDFANNDNTNGNMLILNVLATTGNPISASSGLIYLDDQPNDCLSSQANQNKPMTLNVIYFVKNGSLWRRVVMPSNYATAGCAVPWQQPSCNPAFMTNPANVGAPIAFCKTQDIKLVDNMTASDFVVQYFNTASSVSADAVANDTTKTVTERNTALEALTTVGASITVNTTAAGRAISQSGTVRTTKLDINASTVAPIVVPVTPVAPVVSSSLSAPTSSVVTWPSVQGATGYTVDYNINGGAWTNGFTNQNTTSYTVTTATHNDVVNVRVSATNTAGTSSYGTSSLTIPLWITPALLNNWTDYGGVFTTAGYTKTSSGMVMLKGLIKAGSQTSNTTIFTLPVGYRPAYNLIFQNASNSAAGRIDVWADGTVRFQIGSNAWFSLDNINFMPSGVGSWTNLTPLLNSWINLTGSSYDNPLAYMTDSTGRIRLKGYIGNGNATSGTDIAIVPAAAVPSLYTHIGIDSGNANGHFSLDPSNNALEAKGYSNAWYSIQALYYPSSRPVSGSCPAATTGWCGLTFQNSWKNYTTPPYASGAYTKGTDGVVQLKGLINAGTMSATIAQLPAGYRPKQQVLISTESAGVWGRVDVDTSGNIIAVAGTNTWISLDSLSFLAEQ